MSEKFRVTIPITSIYFDGGPLDGIPRSFPLELWSGSEIPDAETLKAIAGEAMDQNMYPTGDLPMDHFSGSSEPAYYSVRQGDVLYVEQGVRTRFLHRFGWEVINTLKLEDLVEED